MAILKNNPMVKNVAGALVGEMIGKRQGHGIVGAGVGIIATRIATRSLPGALAVGGAIIAKKVYDKRKEQRLIEQRIGSDFDASQQVRQQSDQQFQSERYNVR